MPALDPAASAYLDTLAAVKPAFYAWLDILGDNIRATTAGHDVTIAGSGDSELDGLYLGVNSEVVNVGSVTHAEGGSQTVNISLSGLLLPDAELIETIGDTSKWQGRVARLWVQVRDESGTERGVIAPYYTGYMSSLDIIPSPASQMINLSIENYLVTLNEASGRTYQSQRLYDPADTSAAASISSANNAKTGPTSGAATAPYVDPSLVNAAVAYGYPPAW